MSSSIWTRCAGEREIGPLSLRAWRVVEAQHLVSTRKLVDSSEEQDLLERLLEASKPPPPDDAAPSLHYLLFTPFRYPPLRHGSRFGTRAERGLWYGSEELRTAFAEVTYYRLLFLEGTKAELEPVVVALTAFSASLRTKRGIDLTRPPFARYERTLASKTRYTATQPLGRAMRESGVELFLFRSARDAERGQNVGVLTPRAFGARSPKNFQTWTCVVTRQLVELSRQDFPVRARFSFPQAQFLVRGKLPAPGLPLP